MTRVSALRPRFASPAQVMLDVCDSWPWLRIYRAVALTPLLVPALLALARVTLTRSSYDA